MVIWPKKKAFQIFYQDASVLAKLARQIHLEKPDPLISAAKWQNTIYYKEMLLYILLLLWKTQVSLRTEWSLQEVLISFWMTLCQHTCASPPQCPSRVNFLNMISIFASGTLWDPCLSKPSIFHLKSWVDFGPLNRYVSSEILTPL